MKSVPFINFAPQTTAVKDRLLEAVSSVLDSGHFILGKEVEAFEKEFAAYCGTPYAIGVSDGTKAIYLALLALEIGAGDEVITTSNSFLATASAIVLAGAKPVFVDVGDDMNMDPEALERVITPRTKAIIPVHLTGRLSKMERICEIAKKHHLYVIEDSAQAVGAMRSQKKSGSFGDIGCFSLHPLKVLHVFGDGGVMTVKDKKLYEKLLMLRNLGMKNRNECVQWAFHSRLDEIHAAMVRVNLTHLEKWIDERRVLVKRYHKALESIVKIPKEEESERSVYQTYVVRAPQRDSLMNYLTENGVEAKIHYPLPIHCQAAAKNLQVKDSDLPETMRQNREILSLPIYPGLTEEAQDYVITHVRKFYEGRV